VVLLWGLCGRFFGVCLQQHGGGYWHRGLPCVGVLCYLGACCLSLLLLGVYCYSSTCFLVVAQFDNVLYSDCCIINKIFCSKNKIKRQTANLFRIQQI
jgi:hypothetical protein